MYRCQNITSVVMLIERITKIIEWLTGGLQILYYTDPECEVVGDVVIED